MNNEDELLKIVEEVERFTAPITGAMEWAEDEIGAAIGRHHDAAEQLDRSWKLLMPTFDQMNELMFRSHCRELLNRVVAGEDTRPGTAAECCLILRAVSLAVPLNTVAAGLYARMWKLAELPAFELTDASVHYEALEGSAIDDLEAELRNKLRQEWRKL